MKIKLGNNESFYIEKNGASREILAEIDDINNIIDIIEGTFHYDTLLGLVNADALIPGHKYLLDDYTMYGSDYSFNNFAIILTAIDSNHFSEDAELYPTTNSLANYSSWLNVNEFKKYVSNIKVKYCLIPNETRFAWALGANTGLIYRMIDQYGNDMPFDFIHYVAKRFGGVGKCKLHDTEVFLPFIEDANICPAMSTITECLPNNLSDNVTRTLSNYCGFDFVDMTDAVNDMRGGNKRNEYVISSISILTTEPMNLLLPINSEHLPSGHGEDVNKHPVNNVIKPRYRVLESGEDVLNQMVLPNITMMLNSTDTPVRINNNYFGANVDNISIVSSVIENNRFNGEINNVFFGGYETQNINITETAYMENVIITSLINVNIGGYLENTWFCYPIVDSCINGKLVDTLFFHTDSSSSAKAYNVNIERDVIIHRSVLCFPIIATSGSRGSQNTSFTLRELSIENSAIVYRYHDSQYQLLYPNIRLLSGRIDSYNFNYYSQIFLDASIVTYICGDNAVLLVLPPFLQDNPLETIRPIGS